MNKIFENLELNFLQKNYTALENHFSRKKVSDYNMEDWNNVISISFDSNSKLSHKAFQIIADLQSLNTIDLDSYDCNYDLTIDDYNLCKSKNVNIVFNHNMKYTDIEINKIIHKKQFDALVAQRTKLLDQIEMINASINDLGIVEYY